MKSKPEFIIGVSILVFVKKTAVLVSCLFVSTGVIDGMSIEISTCWQRPHSLTFSQRSLFLQLVSTTYLKQGETKGEFKLYSHWFCCLCNGVNDNEMDYYPVLT